MAEKKNIVIKLKYPVGQTGKLTGQVSSDSAKTITVWNVKRIAGVVCALLALLGLLLFAIRPKAVQAPVPDTPAPSPMQPSAANNQSASPEGLPSVSTVQPPSTVAVAPVVAPSPQAATNQNVVRAILTTKVVDSEPQGQIDLPVLAGEKDPVALFYFVELSNMKGKTVIHEWLLDDKLVSQKKVNVSDTTWRTISKQSVAFTTTSNWVVRLVDEQGAVLSQQSFKVALKK